MDDPVTLPIHMRRVGFDPDPGLAALRDDEGVRRVPGLLGYDHVWVVTRYADVREVLGDSGRFSNIHRGDLQTPATAELTDEQLAELRAGNLLLYDPPEHTRLRRMLTSEFTIRRMRRLEPRV